MLLQLVQRMQLQSLSLQQLRLPQLLQLSLVLCLLLCCTIPLQAQHTVSIDGLSPQVYAELERQGRPYVPRVPLHARKSESEGRYQPNEDSDEENEDSRSDTNENDAHNFSDETSDLRISDPLTRRSQRTSRRSNRQWKTPERNNFDDYEHAGERLVWYDDFAEFDLSVWQHELTLGGGGNYEFQYYTNNRTNSYTRDGVLYLRPTLTADTLGGEDKLYRDTTLDIWGASPADMCTGNAYFGCSRTAGAEGNILNPIQSARIRTVDSFSFKYGRFEVSARLPVGDWLWSAIWLLPKYNAYGNWCASGEIDLLEATGNDESYKNKGCNTFSSALHWGPFASEDKYNETLAAYHASEGTTLHDDFHVYGLRWTEDYIYTYIDEDTESNRVLYVDFTEQSFWERGKFGERNLHNPWAGRPDNAPFDQPFYILMNVAVGGLSGFFPDDLGNKPWNNTQLLAANSFYAAKDEWYPTWQGEHAALQIDWIKVFQNEDELKLKRTATRDHNKRKSSNI